MMDYIVKIFILLFIVISAEKDVFTHEWAVEIIGGEDVAKQIAERNNFEYMGKILTDVYRLKHKHLVKRSVEKSLHHHDALILEPAIKWVEQQRVLRRTKRDFEHMLERKRRSLENIEMDDPKWLSMWYLNRFDGLDMNVQKAWESGMTGKGVVVTVVDDGLEIDNPDLHLNYDPGASFDVNENDSDPTPRYDLVNSNRHGTRCAGVIAAEANNSFCGRGVAYKASIGGVRMLDGDVTDAVEAQSFTINSNYIDIYSVSWGPDDDGRSVDGPGELVTRAFIDCIKNGREGKGSIFVFSSGHGGRDNDNCNCDGYNTAIWTISISSITERGTAPWYSEMCSSILASTYSSGSGNDRAGITTDLHSKCTEKHTGTSFSANLAAGICALTLQSNKNLTWRDMQHIIVRTARPAFLEHPDWKTNGVGRKVSHRFGYGLMDANNMVELARNWITVPPQKDCKIHLPNIKKMTAIENRVTVTLEVNETCSVYHLEHVQAEISLSSDNRGDISIFLTSPAGTKSTLLTKRHRDHSKQGFHSWPFMTVHMWGESPFGIWKLEIHDSAKGKSTLVDWSLILYGTETEPNFSKSSGFGNQNAGYQEENKKYKWNNVSSNCSRCNCTKQLDYCLNNMTSRSVRKMAINNFEIFNTNENCSDLAEALDCLINTDEEFALNCTTSERMITRENSSLNQNYEDTLERQEENNLKNATEILGKLLEKVSSMEEKLNKIQENLEISRPVSINQDDSIGAKSRQFFEDLVG